MGRYRGERGRMGPAEQYPTRHGRRGRHGMRGGGNPFGEDDGRWSSRGEEWRGGGWGDMWDYEEPDDFGRSGFHSAETYDPRFGYPQQGQQHGHPRGGPSRYGSGGGRVRAPQHLRHAAEEDDDRNFFDRAGDEVRSWFGDEEAGRRRLRDAGHGGRGPKNYIRSDERILEEVNDRLTFDRHIDASDIEVAVQGGEVTLSGTVTDRFAKRHAEDIVEDISGVKHVQNNLRYGGSTPSSPI